MLLQLPLYALHACHEPWHDACCQRQNTRNSCAAVHSNLNLKPGQLVLHVCCCRACSSVKHNTLLILLLLLLLILPSQLCEAQHALRGQLRQWLQGRLLLQVCQRRVDQHRRRLLQLSCTWDTPDGTLQMGRFGWDTLNEAAVTASAEGVGRHQRRLQQPCSSDRDTPDGTRHHTGHKMRDISSGTHWAGQSLVGMDE